MKTMTQKDKQLLLKDLCQRLPYGVVCHTEEGDGYLCSINQTIFGTEYGLNINPLKRDYFNDSETDEQAIKPYLRPMSSMTEAEKAFYTILIETISTTQDMECLPRRCEYMFRWLRANHFDYMGLIPKELALEASADMYKTE